MSKVIMNLAFAVLGLVAVVMYYPLFSVRSPSIILIFVFIFLQVERIQTTKSLDVNKWVQPSNLFLLLVSILILCVTLLNGLLP